MGKLAGGLVLNIIDFIKKNMWSHNILKLNYLEVFQQVSFFTFL